MAWRRWKNDWRKEKSWKPPRSRVPQWTRTIWTMATSRHLAMAMPFFWGMVFRDKVVNMWHMWQKHLESLVISYWLHIQPHHNSFVSKIYELLTSTLHFFKIHIGIVGEILHPHFVVFPWIWCQHAYPKSSLSSLGFCSLFNLFNLFNLKATLKKHNKNHPGNWGKHPISASPVIR